MTIFSRIIAVCSAVIIMIAPVVAAAQASRPISGVIAATSGTVDISYTNEDGQQIGRTVGIGDPIYLNDEIKTGPDTSLQILLKDQTVFSLGPNGSIVFDEFIYDPTGGEEPSFSASVTKGTFKFISGKIATAKPEAMKINLPNATASIRGTAVAGRVKEEGDSDIILLTGAITVTPEDGSAPADIFQSGWGTSISTSGIVAEPFMVPSEVLNDILSTVEITTLLPQSVTSGDESDSSPRTVAQTTLAPEDVETIEQLVEVVVANVAADEEGNINLDDLAQFILSSGLAEQLGISPEDLEDDANSNLNIEAELLSYLAAGGQPLWLTVNSDSGVQFINPPPASWANENQQSFRYQQWALYQNTYDGLVSTSYQGSVSYGKTGLALGTGTLINTAPSGYGSDTVSFTNPNAGSGSLDYAVVLNYDAGSITGNMNLRDMTSGNVNFDDQSANIEVTSFTGGILEMEPLLIGLELASGTNLGSDTTDTGRFTFEGSFGSITDGTNTLDGSIASFNLEYYNESSQVFAELTDISGVRSFIDEAGARMNFNNNDWTDNGDNTFTGTNVTYNVGERVVVDSNNNAIDGVFSNNNNNLSYNGTNYTLNVNQNGPNFYADVNDQNNQLYVYQGVEIPALKVEQYESGTVNE